LIDDDDDDSFNHISVIAAMSQWFYRAAVILMPVMAIYQGKIYYQ
jgi:hypothetical protein